MNVERFAGIRTPFYYYDTNILRQTLDAINTEIKKHDNYFVQKRAFKELKQGIFKYAPLSRGKLCKLLGESSSEALPASSCRNQCRYSLSLIHYLCPFDLAKIMRPAEV